MATQYDAAEFVDGDFQKSNFGPLPSAGGTGPLPRGPSREEVDSKVAEAHQRLAELKRAQEELERERTALEETRRRQAELATGRQEILENLTRGVGLLEEAEFTARRDAEQLSRTLTDFKDALAKVQAVREETWTAENFSVELTRALTAVENARMEWNGARLKFPILNTQAPEVGVVPTSIPASVPGSLLASHSFGDLCRIGFAFTWPLALVATIALGVLIAALLRR